ncbi:hypothetical protein Mpop_4467 [Methylorubrum populi BJ001]|uniref:Uncharacterized protein n=1 Tax=Methylorubrum populi (strain ATCC BAA-705 / NCIMB 13946 / BJ001) TaxID=441620 RepID=B1ZFV7_METPB|nr:hypothetical protein [Methylorubrum populi]ACB82566.1 hypothetical protein Mpop_4467 [Methylorubrum populi BJ001]
MNACKVERAAKHPVQTEAIAIRARRSLRSQTDSREGPAVAGPEAPSSRASGLARMRR